MLPCSFLVAAQQLKHDASHLDDTGRFADADQADRRLRLIVAQVTSSPAVRQHNAISDESKTNGAHGILRTLRGEVVRLLKAVQQECCSFSPVQQHLAEVLVSMVLQKIDAVHIALLPATQVMYGAAKCSHLVRTNPSIRSAGAKETIISKTQAVLERVQALANKSIFPNGLDALKYIHKKLNALIGLTEGTLSAEAITNQIAEEGQKRSSINSPTAPQVAQSDQAEGVRQQLKTVTRLNQMHNRTELNRRAWLLKFG